MRRSKMPKFSYKLIRDNLKDVLRTMKPKGDDWTCDAAALDILEGTQQHPHAEIQEEGRRALMYIGLMQMYQRVESEVKDRQILGLLKAALKGSEVDFDELSVRAGRPDGHQANLAYGYLKALRAWEK